MQGHCLAHSLCPAPFPSFTGGLSCLCPGATEAIPSNAQHGQDGAQSLALSGPALGCLISLPGLSAQLPRLVLHEPQGSTALGSTVRPHAGCFTFPSGHVPRHLHSRFLLHCTSVRIAWPGADYHASAWLTRMYEVTGSQKPNLRPKMMKEPRGPRSAHHSQCCRGQALLP